MNIAPIIRFNNLELDEQLSQSALSNKALDKYIEISTHLINMEDVVSARKLLLSIGFTKKSIEKFIKIEKKMLKCKYQKILNLCLKAKFQKNI